MKLRNVVKMTLAGVALSAATVAWAGTAVTGTGDTPSRAMDDANRRAAELSQQRWGRSSCMTPATFERCRKQDGIWVCVAYVNNEAGSSC